MVDTIYALATAKGPAGVAIIRVSGPEASHSIRILCPKLDLIPRKVHFTSIINKGDHIDDAIILYYPNPNSFTGEDVVEFQIHGSPAIIKDMLSILSSIDNFRIADPGEFSRRAFDNRKLDLTSVEGVADLVRAETTEQRRQALKQLNGQHGKKYDEWRLKLIKILSVCEAEIDFVEDEIPDNLITAALPNIEKLNKEISDYLCDNHFGERIKEGFRIAIIGEPNVGKSSLLNYLAKKDVAIVSHIQGTTRDIIEIQLDINGFPVIIADTAGLRETQDDIEKEGIRRAKEWSENADIIINMFDNMNSDKIPKISPEKFITVLNKIDINVNENIKNCIKISIDDSYGINNLIEEIYKKIEKTKLSSSSIYITNERHRFHLKKCLFHIEKAIINPIAELFVEDIRLAARELGKITGKIDVEDLLDQIFANFCIGK